MRRLFGWAAGIVSVAALARLLGRRQRAEAPAGPAPDPADELRRKLEAARTPGSDDGAPGPTAAPDVVETLEERRARVHAKAQEALDEMRRDET